ncbi:MAG: hypothetical protein DRK00_01625 [Thermoprotei archaeon]|nr:MAG: hypothetical protein DRK00_01625 [Thermoprotei archaeon]
MDFVLYLEAHQPRRLRAQLSSRIVKADDVLDESLDRRVFERVAEKCYRPLLKLLESVGGLRVAMKLTGTLLEQMESWGDDLIEMVRGLAWEGRIELVAGPYYNSVAGLVDEGELVEQTRRHVELLAELTGVRPACFANPYLIYYDEIGELVSRELGLRVIITEGSPRVLGWRAPSYVYKARASDARLLLRDYRLSDEVAFGLPRGQVRVDEYAAKVSRVEGQVVLVGLPAETFGEHAPASMEAFDFLRRLPSELSKYPWVRISTPSETVKRYKPVDELRVRQPVSWLEDKGLSTLTGSPLQVAAIEILRELMPRALASPLARAWRLLSQADILYSMRRDLKTFLEFERAACALRSSLEG